MHLSVSWDSQQAEEYTGPSVCGICGHTHLLSLGALPIKPASVSGDANQDCFDQWCCSEALFSTKFWELLTTGRASTEDTAAVCHKCRRGRTSHFQAPCMAHRVMCVACLYATLLAEQ